MPQDCLQPFFLPADHIHHLTLEEEIAITPLPLDYRTQTLHSTFVKLRLPSGIRNSYDFWRGSVNVGKYVDDLVARDLVFDQVKSLIRYSIAQDELGDTRAEIGDRTATSDRVQEISHARYSHPVLAQIMVHLKRIRLDRRSKGSAPQPPITYLPHSRESKR